MDELNFRLLDPNAKSSKDFTESYKIRKFYNKNNLFSDFVQVFTK